MIKPALTQSILQRSQDFSNIKQNQDMKPAVEQANIQVATKKEEIKKNEQVVKQEDTRFGENKFDAKEKGKNEYTNIFAKKKKKEEETDGVVKVKTAQRFDAKI